MTEINAMDASRSIVKNGAARQPEVNMLRGLLSSQDPGELREVINYLGIAAFIVDVTPDREFHLSAINETHEQMTGLRHEDVAGRTLDSILDSETAKRVKENYSRCIREGAAIQYEELLDLPVGEKYWRTTLVPFYNVEGRVFRILGTAYEISDAVRLKLQTRYQSTLMSVYLDESPDGILVVDANNEIKTWNRRFLEMWDIPEDILQAGDGRSALEAVRNQVENPDEFVERIMELYRHLDQEERSYRIDLKNGNVLERYSRGLRDETGRYWGRIWFYRDVTEHERLTEQLNYMARTDPLTETANRRAFMEELSDEIQRSRRYRHPLTLLALDVDHFKSVNDRFGHVMGDTVLRMLADTVRSQLRDTDFFARMGGEEFTVLLPETELKTGARLAERLRQSIEAVRMASDDAEFQISTSVGVAELADAEEPDGLLNRADRALYAAKASGRNRVTCAD
ncbi:sensor domain-containing diguanylate cyclase [Saccharospirillum salsuginis]|uniref:diguanylate cyclase n=1 Tax=Saccharospirillum salsuginis TaxID=418750 RepID=A0A918K0W4_9GAMM|nr:diguanylate cyclase [Saccharospirillum salsuginis]GGX38910.1 hypothetical protein GCM10007392_01460 [Saccharospirillum salsuginis]